MSVSDAGPPLVDRELSWLAFSGRVLQEAEDPSVPLLERLFFCGIFSSNLDEYFRVRVASLRSLLRLGGADTGRLGFSPHRLLHDIHRIVVAQQERYGAILSELERLLEAEGIRRVDEAGVTSLQAPWVRRTFREKIRPLVDPVPLEGPDGSRPFLRNQVSYLVFETWPTDDGRIRSWAPEYYLVEVPSPPLDRFLLLPDAGGGATYIFLDDVLRFCSGELFPEREVGRAFAVKLTRDAELHLDDEFEGDLVAAIRSSLSRREQGVPSRFLYDMRAPYVLVHALQHGLGLEEEDLVLGGRYHNLSDYVSFPRLGRTDLSYPEWPPIPHPSLDRAATVREAMEVADQIVHPPYQSFDPVVRFLREAAEDDSVREIWLTVYRVARDSAILSALLDAAAAGKGVSVFMEVQARFDEESNLHWADRLQAAGARILYSIPGLKVHAKLALVVREAGEGPRRYAYIGTGNFNEKTARVYADHGLFTTHEGITGDVAQVFRFLAGEIERPATEHLLVAPFTLREGFYRLLDDEAEAARAGAPSGALLKMNALEDPDIIERLYRTSQAGVPIDVIVRGICRLVPGLPGWSETIRARSILDRYLEHARIYRFHAGGRDVMYLASADWMRRNLSRRVEVAVPVYDAAVRAQLHRLLELQLADNTKARRIDAEGTSPRVDGGPYPIRAQQAFREYLQELALG